MLLEEITEREKVAEGSKENVDRKKEQDKATAQGMRKQAMEKMGQTTKRKSQEEGKGVMEEKRKEKEKERELCCGVHERKM